MSNNLITAPVVSLQNGKPMANSRDVAELFGKRHDHVLRAIDKLVFDGPPILGNLFSCHEQYHDKANKLVRGYSMTKDGFTLLAMGFTGRDALRFKIAYIQRFNEMEQALHGAARSNAIGFNEVREFLSWIGCTFGCDPRRSSRSPNAARCHLGRFPIPARATRAPDR